MVDKTNDDYVREENAIRNTYARLAQAHSRNQYRKTSDGKSEINGPLTFEALKNTDTWTMLSKEQRVAAEDFAKEEYDSGLSGGTDRRFFIQTDLGTNGKSSGQSRVLTGKLRVETDLPPRVYVEDVLPTTGAIDKSLRSAVKARLHNDGALDQENADVLVKSVAAAEKTNKQSADGKTDLDGPLYWKEVIQTKAYKSLSKEQQAELKAQVDGLERPHSGGFSPLLLVESHVGAAGELTPSRIHIGYAYSPSAPRENRPGEVQPAETLAPGEFITRSFNVSNGKTSRFELPIPMKSDDDSHLSDGSVKQIIETTAEAEKTNKLSSHRSTPEASLAAALAKGTSSATIDDGQPRAPATPVVLANKDRLL